MTRKGFPFFRTSTMPGRPTNTHRQRGKRNLMDSRGQLTLTLLHDLALLYLGLAHGADEDLDPKETMEIASKLRRWQPDKDPALIDHVMREAMLTYLNGATDQRMHEAAQILGGKLKHDLLKAILGDLVDIARADGSVVANEKSFIAEIAEVWNLQAYPS